MFETEVEEWADEMYPCDGQAQQYLIMGAEFGYNKGYHDAEEHYLNVIDNQHKLVDESKKKHFRKCMKCTDGTYQSGFKDGYNKANEWQYVSEKGFPKDEKTYFVIIDYGALGRECTVMENLNKDKPKEVIAWKEIVLPELKESK